MFEDCEQACLSAVCQAKLEAWTPVLQHPTGQFPAVRSVLEEIQAWSDRAQSAAALEEALRLVTELLQIEFPAHAPLLHQLNDAYIYRPAWVCMEAIQRNLLRTYEVML